VKTKKRLKTMKTSCKILCLVSAAAAACAAAQADSTTRCDSAIHAVHIDACNSSLGGCLKRARPGDLAVRLDRFGAWLASKDKPCSTMVKDVEERAATLQDTARFAIDTSQVTFAGAAAAPVRIVMYVSATCPLCKRIYHELYDSVTAGGLTGKARLGIKPFSAKPLDVMLLAARRFGRQADLMRSLAGVEVRITEAIVLKKADSIGIPAHELRKLAADSAIVRAAVGSAEEGGRNGVTVTPTIFINNRRYKSYKDPQWVVDAAEYAFSNVRRASALPVK